MGPKVTAACAFAQATGRTAAIGPLEDVGAMLRGEAGTVVSLDAVGIDDTARAASTRSDGRCGKSAQRRLTGRIAFGVIPDGSRGALAETGDVSRSDTLKAAQEEREQCARRSRSVGSSRRPC